jgi:carboxylesterase type B
VFGSKDWSGDPAALFQGLSKTEAKFITVSSNYRLGALGWLSAPGQDMTANAGIWDGLAALEWTQKYIELFGGDAERITAMRESAGGGIIDHLITAHGGKGHVPFSQVSTIPFYFHNLS